MDQMPTPVRERTISWDDPREALRRGMERDGLGYLKAVLAGEIPRPPMAWLMDMELAEVERGRAVFTVRPQEFHFNPMGVVHGGLAATLIDSATGCAVQSTLAAGEVMTTVDLRVTYVRPLRGGEAVSCVGWVIHQGRSMAMAEAKLTDGEDRLIAYGGATCRIVRATAGG